MTVIVSPKEHIAKLWSRQEAREGVCFRMMRYVMRVDHDGKILLHNVVTGQLSVLDSEEAALLGTLPAIYTPAMDELIDGHYLVPKDYDEHALAMGLRKVLRTLDEANQSKDIFHYTILPTTACNARCYYCFEQGSEIVTMTEETAEDVIRFIRDHCGGKPVLIKWFGGEPTVAVNRIDQICYGLQREGVIFDSEITTNGYLFDEVLVQKADELWKLKEAMICLDGTEEKYNRTKAYVNARDNPYQRVMRNVGLLLDKRIRVHLRMNFDLGNWEDFKDIVQQAKDRFGENQYLQVTAHPVVGEHADSQGRISHGDTSWFEGKIVELQDIAREARFLRQSDKLPYLQHRGCEAISNASVTIHANGMLVRCPEQFGEDQRTGDIKKGITNQILVQNWKELAAYPKCINCQLYPNCIRTKNCSVKDRCEYYPEKRGNFERAIIMRYCKNGNRGNEQHEI